MPVKKSYVRTCPEDSYSGQEYHIEYVQMSSYPSVSDISRVPSSSPYSPDLGANAQNRRNGHHDCQIFFHICAQFFIRNLTHLVHIDHRSGYKYLLVNTLDHDLFIDRLIFSSNIISVEILIHIIHLTYMWKRIIYIDIIYIECMISVM